MTETDLNWTETDPNMTETVFHVPTLVHGRIVLEAPPEPTALLVGFHGYAQTGEDALAFLRPLALGKSWAIAGPQALHPFYRPRDQAVVAGWMTRQDRELALADNVAYTARALAELRARLPTAGKLAIVGFSQGVAMAYRAAAFAQRPCDGVIALAADVPPDVAPLAASLPKVLIGRGTRDEWYTGEKAAKDRDVLEQAGVTVIEHVFDGGHEWAPEFIAKCSAFIDELLLS